MPVGGRYKNTKYGHNASGDDVFFILIPIFAVVLLIAMIGEARRAKIRPNHNTTQKETRHVQ
jgi:ABC-type phosphate/phosphonate transport system permease subunit